MAFILNVFPVQLTELTALIQRIMVNILFENVEVIFVIKFVS